MWIQKVNAWAFGPFEGEELPLGEGMNVVHGPNESGKSTWHGALYAALCGIRRGRGRARADDQRFDDKHRPRHLDRWEVSATVQLDNGRRLELRHDLAGKVDSAIIDLTTTEDVSSDHMFDGAPDGSRLLGLNRDTAPSVIFVRQAQILAVTEGVEGLQGQLQLAADASGRGETAESALGIIRDFRRERIGSEMRNSTKPLRSAIVEHELSQEALRDARRQHDEYLALLREEQNAEDAAREASQRVEVAEALRAHQQFATLEARLTEAEKIARELPAERPADEDDSAHVDAVKEVLRAYWNRPAQEEAPAGRAAESMENDLRKLPMEAPVGDVEVHPTVQRALDYLHGKRAVLESLRQEERRSDDDSLAGFSARALVKLAEELEAPIPVVDAELEAEVESGRGVRGTTTSRLLPVVGTLLAVVGVALLLTTSPVAGGVLTVLGVGLLLWSVLRASPSDSSDMISKQSHLAVQRENRQQAHRRRDEAAEKAQELGVSTDPEELRRFAQRVEDAEQQRRQLEKQQKILAEAVAEVEGAEWAVRDALNTRGVTESADSAIAVDELVAQYQGACRRRAEQANAVKEREALASAISDRREVETAWEQRRLARDEAENDLRGVAEQIGVSASDLEEAAASAQQWVEDKQEERKRRVQAREGWAKLDGILQGQEMGELREQVSRARSSLPEFPRASAGMPELSDPDALPTLRRQSDSASERAAELRGKVEERAAQIPDVAVAEERRAAADEELIRVRSLEALLSRTEGYLQDARDQIRHRIAPRLQEEVERHLSAVTGNRYSDVLIHPETLEVKVRDGRGNYVEADRLSHGTAEQIYLLLRIGLAEFFASTGEKAPLILDDVTVHFDQSRTRAVLDMLLRLSDERQVVLFSQEQDVLEWARANLESERNRLVELQGAPTLSGVPG